MGSVNGNGHRGRGPGRRDDRFRRQRTRPRLEVLEERQLLNGDVQVQVGGPPPTINEVKTGPLAEAGYELIAIYQEHQRFLQGGGGQFVSQYNPYVMMRGERVLLNVYTNSPYEAFVASLRNLGMEIANNGLDPNRRLVEGYLPINRLPDLVALPAVNGMTAVGRPIRHNQGAANNQGEQALFADTAKTQFNVNGAGIIVGVLSDSANQFDDPALPMVGLNESIASGDLPPLSRINLLDDTATGANTDEGRAMLEHIFDIAPGANLAFATAFNGIMAFANNIRALSRVAQAQVIVDDVSYRDETYFQDGPIAQAVNDVVRVDNRVYFSSAGNQDDGGFESPFRGVTTTVGSLGNGRFMDFDPGAGVLAQLPIVVTTPGQIVFQYDNPLGTITADLDFFVLDANGNNVLQGGNSNNLATGQPIEVGIVPNAGNFTIVVQVRAGSPDVGLIRFREFGSVVDFSRQFGSAGGITYPSAAGHNASESTISVGAVPFFNAPPFGTQAPLLSEPFSSHGPVRIVFSPSGQRLPSVQTLQKPDVSGIDAANTTFFPPGGDIPQDADTFPNFFGTSASAPNLAAVAALMRQLSPGVSNTDVRNAMIASAAPVNGQTRGTFDVQSGFGLVQAPAALTAVDRLRVTSSFPASGQTLNTAPPVVILGFNRPISQATLGANDIVFTQLPPGVTVTVGAPFFNPANPTAVAYPLTFNTSGNATANGTYRFALAAGAVSSTDGRPVIAFSSSFAISDVAAPKVTNTIFQGRIVVAQFSETIRPGTIDKGSVLLVRTGSSGVFNNPTNVIVSSDPRAIVFHDMPNNRVIIDLSAVPQSALPTDTYALVINDTVRDVVGNRLDGEFRGVFPSGDNTAGGNFVQVLTNQQLRAPQIASIQLDPGDPTATPPRLTSDTGTLGDGNTRGMVVAINQAGNTITTNRRPKLVGQLTSAFPGAVSGVTVVAQFNALNNGTFDLRLGAGTPPRGFSGSFDFQTVTDANGRFTITPPADLPDGFNIVRIVVVGPPDQPPLPGFSSTLDVPFRIDNTNPVFTQASLAPNSRVGQLRGLSLFVVDPVEPSRLGDPLAVPRQFSVPTLNPATASNINNYSLINVGPDRIRGTADDRDFSSFITAATYVDTTIRNQTNDFFTGRVDLSFRSGLPAGRYVVVARTPQPGFQGIVDAAGNPIDSNAGMAGAQDFEIPIEFQPTPVFITLVQALSPDNDGSGFVTSGPRQFFELPVPGFTPRAETPPDTFVIDFSTSLPRTDANGIDIDYSNRIQLIRSANGSIAAPDGDFGDLGLAGGTGQGFSRVANTSVVLTNEVPGARFGEPGFQNRLILRLPAGTTLAADSYRLYIPNTGANAIIDEFGNQLDGEFLGNPRADGSNPVVMNDTPVTPLFYETLLPTGVIRNGLSGDLVPGGAFMTGYVVVPGQAIVQGQIQGNIIYARPDYIDNPTLSADDPDGSILKPYPGLAPEAIPNAANGGDLNSPANFGTGFDTRFDRNGSLQRSFGTRGFDRSALFAAQQASARGPVVVIALPSTNDLRETFVMQASRETDPNSPAIDASASVPFNTQMVFAPGSILKMSNASLFVQNQGTSIQTLGGANPRERVTFTSYADDQIPGDIVRDTNGDGPPAQGGRLPRGGDWGGLTLRNYDDQSNGGRPIPVANGPINDPNRPFLGRSGADDALSSINFAQVRFAGGAVPQTIGYRFDAITLFNSRPSITNSSISIFAEGAPDAALSAQAAISADLDSFREDDTARGLLVRKTQVFNNSINGILVRAELNGVVEPTDALFYPDNPATLGGIDQNYTFDDTLPYVFVTRMEIGVRMLHNQGQQTEAISNRIYVQPGMLLKFQRGAAIDQIVDLSQFGLPLNRPSLNVGDRTYIRQFDARNDFGPSDPNFSPNAVGDARVVFTSLFDDLTSTFFEDPNDIDPVTRRPRRRTIVPAIDSDNAGLVNQPTPGNVPDLARWGSIRVDSGAIASIDEALFQFGGGSVNTAGGTIGQRDVLAFQNAGGFMAFGQVLQPALGTRAIITNNDFFDNREAPISVLPDGLLAADPQRPLLSGNPFFRGNVMLRNDLNGLEVIPPLNNRNGTTTFGFVPTVSVDSVWDDTDLTYLLRDRVSLNGTFFAFPTPSPIPPGTPNSPGAPEQQPFITLTVQSSLPDALLADGSRIARPGESAIVKLLNDLTVPPIGDGLQGFAQNQFSDTRAGAGFIVGIDDGVDPPADPLVDAGALSQLRFLGIGANETTGQQRVPVIITSMRDSTVGRTVRGVTMNEGISPTALTAFGYTGTAPQPGDGGVIGFGSLSLSDYNLFDPRGGNLIDNSDIRFLTRIEQQGGGWVYMGAGGPYNDRIGAFSPETQLNTAKAMTVSNSNLSSFSQVGFLAHPSPFNRLPILPGTTFPAARDALRGQPTISFLVNNTITNMPVGVRIMSEQVSSVGTASAPAEAVLLHNTFDGNGVSLFLQGGPNPGDPAFSTAHVFALAMDNIFSSTTGQAIPPTAHVQVDGRTHGTQGQYNLFTGNTTQVVFGGGLNGTGFAIFQNNQPVIGNPAFRDPANGLYTLLANSDAIDAARSELTASNFGNVLRPISDQVLDATGGTRNNMGRINGFGGLVNIAGPGDFVSLPGLSRQSRGFSDQFVAALDNTPLAADGPANPAGDGGSTFRYRPIEGERDQSGFLRQDTPGRANVGFGSRPFFDIGANEFRVLNAPRVEDVTAIVDPPGPAGPTTAPIYVVGGVGGTNTTPQVIRVRFNNRLDPTTLNNQTVVLEASEGDGIFGADRSPSDPEDTRIDLSGKLFYDADTRILTIDFGTSNVVLTSDLYRLTLVGTGSDVIRDPQGVALDGENTVGGLPNAPQRALPSGDGLPGGDFFLTFSIDTSPPSVDPTFPLRLDPATDSNRPDNITNNPFPAFTGFVDDIFPPLNAPVGQTVFLDIDREGDGNFERMNAGQATTGANGAFTVTVTGAPLQDSNFNVGPDGLLGTADDSGFSVARIRVVDQSGNVSNPNDPNARVRFIVDTRAPRITSATPTPGTQVAPGPGGTVQITLGVSENLDPARLVPGSIVAVRAGGDGIFGNANDVLLPIDPASIVAIYSPPVGAGTVRFTVQGVGPNDLYRVTLVGSGTGPVIDIAGNAIDGEFAGTFPSGNGQPGGDFNLDFIVFDPSGSRLVFVSSTAAGNTGADGTRARPFRTIGDERLAGPDGQLNTADDVFVPGGLAFARTGDTVAVLAGTTQANVYTESITLRSLIRLVSADVSSTDSRLVPGDALKTVLRSPAVTTGTPAPTVSATNLVSIGSLPTELAGFTIASPLMGNPANGPIAPGSIGIAIDNSDVLIDKNYVIVSDIGIAVILRGQGAPTPRIESNGIIGNINGVIINDTGASSYLNGRSVRLANNTIAYNTTGLVAVMNGPVPIVADLVNNIFFNNADRTPSRTGSAIFATSPGRLSVRFNLFSSNGPNINSPADDTLGVGGAFNPAILQSAPDVQGNIAGNPAFALPVDPRPNADGPGNFFLGANFDLTGASAAIDVGLQSAAPALDFRSRGRVDIPGRGRIGAGPTDIGAFEFNGSGGIPAGGTSRVVTSSFASSGEVRANGLNVTAPGDISFTFANPVDRASVQAGDVMIWGDGIDRSAPVQATSATVSDDGLTVRFGLSGRFRSTGTVAVAIPEGVIRDIHGGSVAGFSDTFKPQSPAAVPVPAPTTPPGEVVVLNRASAVQSVAAVAPTTTTPSVPAGPATTRRRGLFGFRRRR